MTSLAKSDKAMDAGGPPASRGPRSVARPREKREWRIKKLFRLLLFCMGVSLLGAGLAARRAYGDVVDSALLLGRELGKMTEAGAQHPVRLNGQPIFVESTIEEAPIGEVLDRMEAACRSRSAAHVKELDTLTDEAKRSLPVPVDSREAAGVVREQGETSGFVACFVRDGEEREGVSEVIARLSGLLDTGDLNKLGKLRYVFAESTPNGQTHVIGAWTDGAFNLYSLFPEGTGDAPGSDPRGIPRPLSSSRLLTAEIDGVPYAVRLYVSGASPKDVLGAYDEELTKHGWEMAPADPGGEGQRRAFLRAGSALIIQAEPDSDRSVISLIEMRAP